MIARTQTTLSLMVASSALFVVVCGLTLPFTWVTPDLFSLSPDWSVSGASAGSVNICCSKVSGWHRLRPWRHSNTSR